MTIFNYDMFKVSKMTILIVTCSKLAKWLILIMTCSKSAKQLFYLWLVQSSDSSKKQGDPRDFLKARFVKKGTWKW